MCPLLNSGGAQKITAPPVKKKGVLIGARLGQALRQGEEGEGCKAAHARAQASHAQLPGAQRGWGLRSNNKMRAACR